MLEFLKHCVDPHAVMALALAVLFLFGYAIPGYQARNGSFVWLLFLFVGVLAAISWILLVFA